MNMASDPKQDVFSAHNAETVHIGLEKSFSGKQHMWSPLAGTRHYSVKKLQAKADGPFLLMLRLTGLRKIGQTRNT